MGGFTPCQGKSACRYTDARCLTCGRTQQEIEILRSLIDRLTNLAIHYDFQNIDEFADYVAARLTKSFAYRKQETASLSHAARDGCRWDAEIWLPLHLMRMDSALAVPKIDQSDE